MSDIRHKPFFNHNEAIDSLMVPLQSMVDIRLLGYRRLFPNQERFLICTDRQWNIDFYTENQLYRYGLYEKPMKELTSSYDMWDHLPYAPPEIYQHTRKKFGLAHGLHIVQQHENYSDTFVFATQPGNNQINNFYLNQKELFEAFIHDFYERMSNILIDLTAERFALPQGTSFVSHPIQSLTPRQQECARLLIDGLSAKEIARILQLSHRTVEFHIDIMKEKFGAKNRLSLIGLLSKI